MSRHKRYGLFEVTGIELEYMVVERGTLRVLPIVDRLFEDVTGQVVSDVSRGDVEWSNELVSHVLELKTAAPTPRIDSVGPAFAREVRSINERLAKRNAMLLPTAAHPLMDPFAETVIWPHAHSEIYALYNTIFDCRGHGWSNLQSTHLNLPFANDEEFGRLHAAVRLVLPLIPALAASSPILDGSPTGFLDSRMEAYLHHQERLPELMGSLIPEAVFTQEDYHRVVFDPIGRALAPFDPDHVMDHHFANSRGAIARFDRGAIEVRVIDIQECPAADLAIAEMIVAVVGALVNGRWGDPQRQRDRSENDLLSLFMLTIKDAGKASMTDKGFAEVFGATLEECPTVNDLWGHLFNELGDRLSTEARPVIAHILKHGCLAQRILMRLGNTPSRDRIVEVYSLLADHLERNIPFG
ncbi:MAG: glutamate--cysteine ligase [Flavobacteriales bacterium]|nr:glutamate--cysteine ligase [Flavobacteriales bacterium]